MNIKKYILNSLFVALAALNVSELQASATANVGYNSWIIGRNVLAGVSIVSFLWANSRVVGWENKANEEDLSRSKLGWQINDLQAIRSNKAFFEADSSRSTDRIRDRQRQASEWQESFTCVAYGYQFDNISADLGRFRSDYSKAQEREHAEKYDYQIDNERRKEFGEKLDAKIQGLNNRLQEHTKAYNTMINKKWWDLVIPVTATAAALGCWWKASQAR